MSTVGSSKRKHESDSEEDESGGVTRVVVQDVKSGDAAGGNKGELGVVLNLQPIIINCTGSIKDGQSGNCNLKEMNNVKTSKEVKPLKNHALEKSIGTSWMNKIMKLKCKRTEDNKDAKVVGVSLDEENNPVWKLACDDHGGKYKYLNKQDMEDVEEMNMQGKRFDGFNIFPRPRTQRRPN